MNKLITGTIIMATTLTSVATSATLPLTTEWDKTFPKSDKVEHSKVSFRNRFGIELAADVYKPKAGNGERGTGSSRPSPCPARSARSRSSRAVSTPRHSLSAGS